MRVFTIANGKATLGAKVIKHTLSNGMQFPAIIVGEEGRGRSLGIMPVQCNAFETEYNITNASVAQNSNGRYKLIETNNDSDDTHAIVVFRTGIGFRGSNAHTGDKYPQPVIDYSYIEFVERKAKELGIQLNTSPVPNSKHLFIHKEQLDLLVNSGLVPEWNFKYVFKPFPGKWLTKGIIAQGDAGRMGWGEQGVAIIPKGEVFRVGYSGRLYGEPSSYYFVFNGETILFATEEEREATEMF